MITVNNLDPDWQFASRHGKASLTGTLPPQKPNSLKSQICPCCYQFIFKDPIPVFTNPKQLEFLGFGFPLFYIFLKNCMILLVIAICSYNAISLKNAMDNNYVFCHLNSSKTDNQINHRRMLSQQTKCFTFMIQWSRIEPQVSSDQQIIRITSFVIQLLFLIYMRDHIVKLDAYYDQRNVSLSDFSVMLKNMPRQKNIQKKLKDFFSSQFQTPHEIKQITLLPEYPQIDSLNADRLKIINRLRKAYKKQNFQQEDYQDLANMKKIDQAIMEQVIISHQLAKKDQLECQKLILVFNTQQQQQAILEKFDQMNFSQRGPYFGVGAQKITIKQAPQPTQIIWDNVNVPNEQKIFLYILAWILSFFLLALVTLGAYYIYDYKATNLIQALEQYNSHPDERNYLKRFNTAIAIVYIALLFIILFNKLVLSTLYHKLTDIERHETRSKFQFSFGLRYALGLFFTTALMTLIVEALVFNNYDTHPYGVIEQQTVMFFLNAVIVPLYWLINPFHLAKKINRRLNYGKKHLTQKQANTLMQKSQYQMGKRYAQIIQTMWFTFLYATLVPIGAFFSLFGLGLYYWTDKFTLLRRSSVGGEVSGHVVISNMKLLDFTLLLKPLGQLLFDYQLRSHTGLYSTIAMIVVALLYIILPLDKIIQIVNPQKFNFADKTYDEVKQSFKNTYFSQHPILKIIHSEKLKKKIIEKGIVVNIKSSIRNIMLDDFSGYQDQERLPDLQTTNTQDFSSSQNKKL